MLSVSYRKNLILLFSIFFVIFVSTLAFSVLQRNAFAETVDSLQLQIAETNAQKAAIEAEIEKYKEQLDEVGAEKATLSSKIKSLEITQKKLSADIALTQTKINSTNLTISELGNQISVTEQKINDNYAAIAKTIRDIHFNEGNSIIETLLAHESTGDLWNSIGALTQLQKSLKNKVYVLSDIKDTFETQKSTQEEKKEELIDLTEELGDRKEVVDVTKTQQNKVLAETKNKESEYKRILAEKEELRKKFEQEIFEYQNKIKFLLDPSKLPPSGSGVLSWPLENIFVTQHFGVTGDSGRLYKSGSHSGVDFRAAVGTKLMSAASGTVVGVGDTDSQPGCYSYGKWILIEHGNGLSTLYAHLSVISVSKGQSVKVGEVIGYTGETGYSFGPHLHLAVFASEGVEVQRYVNSSYCKKVDIPLANTKAYLDPLEYL